MVGASVTPSIGSSSTAIRGSSASTSCERRREVGRVHAQRRRGRRPARASARAPRGRSASASSTGASFVSALSPMRGIEAWPGAALGGEREAEDALLRHADAVDAPAVVLEHLAGALVHHEVGAHLVRVLLAQPLGAVLGARLLVGGDHELQLARLRPPALLGQRDRRGHLGRHLALHVQRAAAPDAAVAQLARPRVHLPVRRRRPARCPRGRAGTASARRSSAASRAIRFGRPSTADSSSISKPALVEQVRAGTPGPPARCPAG